MTGFQTKINRNVRTQAEIAAENLENSGVGRLIADMNEYAKGRKSDVARGAETPALASLMVEKYGYGLAKAASILGVADSNLLMAEIDRLVLEIDSEHSKHQQHRWQSKPAGLSVTVADGTECRSV
jgi:hypothetical protein